MVRDLSTIVGLGKPTWAAGAIGLLVFLTLFLVRYTGLLQSPELAAYDLVLQLKADTAAREQRVVVIGIEEADIQRLAAWPPSDAVVAETIERLAGLGPSVIGVDMYRDRPVPPGSDRLAQLLQSNADVVFVEKFGSTSARSVAPPAVLVGTEQVGFSDLPVDTDGVVRKSLLFLDNGETVQYSFSLRLALRYLQDFNIVPQPGESDPAFLRLGPTTIRPFEANDGAYTGADARGYQYMLTFDEGAAPFTIYSLTDLHQGRISARDIEGKIVLVGVVADSVKDYFVTPFQRQGGSSAGMPGVVLHAHSISQLLRYALDGTEQLGILAESTEFAWILLWTVAGTLAALMVRSLLWLSLVMALGPGILIAVSYAGFIAGWWIPLVPAMLAWLGSGALVSAYNSGHEKAQRRLVMELFSRHVSADVAEEIWKQRDKFSSGGRLESKKITATVLFSDLEDFTPVSETLDPVNLMEWLNQYMDSMAGIVMKHGGFVDDYYGDAIKANFGVPMGRDSQQGITRDAVSAVRCALAMRREMVHLNRRWAAQGMPEVRMRIGICTGPVVSGCLGSSQRMKYTTIGDTVNTAARLEGYGKQANTVRADDGYCRILLSASTAERLDQHFETEVVGSLELKGKAKPLRVFRVAAETALQVNPVEEGAL
jgi:adenylate cyclase